MSKAWAIDAAERIGLTYVETVLGLVLTNMAGVTSFDTWKTAGIAAVPAALAAVKTLVAGLVPGTVSPASMVPAEDPPWGLPPRV